MSRESIIPGALGLLWIMGALLQAAQLAGCWVCMILIRRMDMFRSLTVSILISMATASTAAPISKEVQS